jgi:DNA mismatch repair protein MutL
MPQIRILPDRVANQIAAGEVVERPAAVVKELVENALDAGATRIEVESREGGRALMRVEDNGSGMGRDDALLSLERHATSKIAQAADLDRLTSFGFRGEALPSIASIARFTLQTRPPAADAGTEVLVNGGKLVHVRDCGRPVGTSILVEHLFQPVPARRKFLKSDATEAAHIAQAVRLYALAFPRVAFTLVQDQRVVFRSPECDSLAERVGEIFGPGFLEALVPIGARAADLEISGLIGRPSQGRSSRHDLITFVNRRPVDSRTLNSALTEAYQGSLPKGRYPLAVLFFQCDPAAVDVNVHPAKREIRFRNEPAVRSFVIASVLGRLRELGAAAAPAGPPGSEAVAPAAPRLRESALPRSAPPILAAEEAPGAFPAAGPGAGQEAAAHAGPAPAPPAGPRPWRWLGLAFGAYGIFETPAGVVLLDRRAAHERIWFERLEAQVRQGAVPSQRLLLPIALELDPIASALLLDQERFLAERGFAVAAFGRNFFRLEAVPGWMEPGDAEPFVRDLLAAVRAGRAGAENSELARESLVRMAGIQAARASARTDEADPLGLVAELFGTQTPLTSPAGRPTLVEISRSELARRFHKP